MSRIILACVLAAILAGTAQAFDGTPLPPNTVPIFQAAPLDLPPGLLAQAPNPGGAAKDTNALIGTWKFNPEKSSANAPLARSAVLTFTGEGQNLRNTAEGIDAQGNAFKITFMHIYDGKPHPSTGNPHYDSTAYTRVDSNNVNVVRFKEGKIAEIGYITVSPDGKTYSGLAQGITANGQQYHSLLVYDRVSETNPLLGTWKLNVEKSTSIGPPAKSGVTTWAPDAQGVLKNSGEIIDAQGQLQQYVFTHIWDGKPHQVTGFPAFNEDTYNRINTNTVNFVRSKDGKAVQMGSLAVSDDGKVLTVTAILTDANGQLVRSAGIWEKQ